MNRFFKLSIMMAGLIIGDQITKGMIQQEFSLGESITIIQGFFNFTYVQNAGAAFGMGAEAGNIPRIIFFKILPVIACFWLIWQIWKFRNDNEKGILSFAYSLVFAGAVGNLMDRITLDYVVDFLDFYYGNSHFPAFNVADSAISVAFVFLVLDMILEAKRKKSIETNINSVE